MCGLCGWIDKSCNMSQHQKTLDNMSDKLNRRGPDKSNTYVKDNIAMMHKRLVVVDKKNGNQPMHLNFNGEHYIIIYNGELYNTKELREELVSLGHNFNGYSDTEILIHSFAEWDIKCFDKLNGIYAFALWQERKKRLILCRDKVGVKPLFYYIYGNSIIFASEIKAILANPIVRPSIDEEGIAQIFMLGPGKVNGSAIYKDIEELEPSEYLEFTFEGYKKQHYWQLRALPHNESLTDTIEHTRSLVIDSIKRQLVSDCSISCLLSGGLDSSIITRIASQYMYNQLITFSVDYEDNDKYFTTNMYQPDSDNIYIKKMVELVNSEHHYVVLNNEDLAQSLGVATDAREYPGMGDIDSSLLLFANKIKDYTKVSLSGECADELFGGYPWYMNEDLLYRDTFPWSNSINLRKNIINKDMVSFNLDEYVNSYYLDTIKATEYLDTDSLIDKRIREMFRLNFYWFMQTLLVRSDRMSSYNSLEIRVPFCDYRIVEYAYNMPWKYKALNGREKGILREAFKDYLPSSIINRKKSPYPKTFSPIFMEKVRNKLKIIIEDKNKLVNQLINKEYIQDLLNEKITLSEPWYGQLMRLPQIYSFIIQLDYFLEDNKVELS